MYSPLRRRVNQSAAICLLLIAIAGVAMLETMSLTTHYVPDESVPTPSSIYATSSRDWGWTLRETTSVSIFEAVSSAPPEHTGRALRSSPPPDWAVGRLRSWQETGEPLVAVKMYAGGLPFRCVLGSVATDPTGHLQIRWEAYFPGMAKNVSIICAISSLPLVFHGTGFLRRRLRFRHLGPGHCLNCGYNLQALPPGSVCPECGPRQNEWRGDYRQ
jgi:hypothetical protein